MPTRNLIIVTDDFPPGGRMPDRFAHDHGNDVPTLNIDGVPPEAVELAVICHDPDAPRPFGFTHWAVYGIPPTTTSIGADAEKTFRTGTNGFGESGWGGPRPPAGHGDHHYYFWVYALDTEVAGEPSREEFLNRYGEHIIEQNRVVGTYST